jgi:glycosyltransferase involved in cell wall biosynthesis
VSDVLAAAPVKAPPVVADEGLDAWRSNPSMRVLEVTESFATGTMEVVRLVAEGAACEGHRVAIAYGERPETPVDLRKEVADHVELVALPWTGRTARTQVHAAHALRRLCRAWKPDVIHLHSAFAGFVGATAVTSFAPTVYTPHGYSFLGAKSPLRRAAYRFAEGVIARRVQMIGAVSEHEARLARSLGARVVEVVPNGIPELDRAREPSGSATTTPGRPTVVTAGRIVSARRPLATARILHSLADVAEVCWIGGPGPDPLLEERVRELGVPVTGWLDREEAVRRLSEATVLLHWSEWDSHPLSVLEAMAFDVPVVGSDIEANRELLGDEQVRATEEDAMQLVRALVSDNGNGCRRAMLDRQRRRRGRFAATRMVHDWLRIYAALADRNGAGVAAGDRRERNGAGTAAGDRRDRNGAGAAAGDRRDLVRGLRA